MNVRCEHFTGPLFGVVTLAIGIGVVLVINALLRSSPADTRVESSEFTSTPPSEDRLPDPGPLVLSCYDPHILPVWSELKKDGSFMDRLRRSTATLSCSELVEVKRLDLNRDGHHEVLVRGKLSTLCSEGSGNCTYWVFDVRDGVAKKLLSGVHQADQHEFGVDEVQTSRSRGYSDILLTDRDGQNVLKFRTYRFDGNEYVQSGCMAEVPRLLRDGAGSWELITCDEHERRRESIRNSLAMGVDLPGCWSSGNGNYFKITEDKIFLSTNRFKPVRFVIEQLSDSAIILRLIDRPQFYYFQEFVSLELDDDEGSFPLTIKDYLSDENLETENHSGTSGWVKDSCKELGLEAKR